MCQLRAGLSHNHAEYKALILCLKVLGTMKAKYIQVMGDSQLIIRQLTGDCKCINLNLLEYYETANELLK